MGKARYKDCQHLLVLIILLCLHHTSSQSTEKGTPPEITRQIYFGSAGSSTILQAGTNLYLAIDARGNSSLRYIWRQDDTVVQNDTNAYYRILNNGLRESHSGIYRVTVENSFGKARSLPLKLTVKELGSFPNVSDTTVNVQAGNATVLSMPEISYLNVKDSFSVEWEKNEAIIDPGIGYYVTLDYNLALLNIPQNFNQARFRVKFTHKTELKFFETYSQNFVLSVTEPPSQNTAAPQFVVLPKNTSARLGQSVKMECAVNGQPLENVQILWYKITSSGQRQVIEANNKFDLSVYNRVLTIGTVDVTDAGAFECEGSLRGQTVNSNIIQRATLTVLVPPTLSQVPSLVTKDFQESVSLPCVAQGSPQPGTSWYFNDKELFSSDTTRYQIDRNNTLSIANVDSPDSGVYQCFAVNEAGESATYTWLLVNSAKPSIIEAPKNITVIQHEDISFTCKVTGGPQPEVFWKKDGVNVTVGGRIFKTQEQLLIGHVEKADSGLYSCNAVNIKGAVSASASLNVIIKTVICKPPQNMSRVLSTDVMLDCGVCKDDSVTPSWAWYFYPAADPQKQNVTSGVDGFQIYPNGSLGISGVLGRHRGKYECLVTSSPGGNDSRIAILSVTDIPSKPIVTAVVLYGQIPNSVLINWTLPYDGDTPIIKFIIENRRETSSGSSIDIQWETVNSNVNANLRAAVITNLLPSRLYRFRVIAVNLVGASVPSEAAPAGEAIKMPAQPPSAAPLNLFCEPRQERAIVVKWEPPPETSWNGDLLGFIIFYKIDSFNDDTEKVKNISGKDVRETNVDNLAYYKRYRIIIAAYNEKGPGVNSSDFLVTTLQGRPDAPPQNVILVTPTSTAIRVDWDPPPSIQLNGVNQGYNIELSQDGALKANISVSFDEQNPTGRQTFTISNLSKYTLYLIQIACKTGAGIGPKSPSQSIRTLEDVPGPVTELKIDNISDRSLRVNWKPPQEVNGVLLGYEVSIQEKNSSSADAFNRTSNYTSHTFSNLKYETAYVIYVRARTNVGFGPASTTEIVSGVPPELPRPPTQLAVTNIEARSVLLQFVPGYDGKTSITLWIVEAQVVGDSSWDRVHTISDPTANQITVYNLHPYTSYTLRVIAQNIVGNSGPSEPCNMFQTKQAVPGMPPQDITPRANSSTSIRIRWMPIPRTEWNGDFLGYKILYRRWSKDVDVNTTSQADVDLVRQSSWTTVELSNGSSIQEHYLSKLEEWMDYQIQMMSYNAVGNSSASATLSERTDEDVPSASPRNVMSTTKSSTTIFVSWSPVPILQQNGNVQGYKVKYIALRAGAEAQFKEVEGAKSLNATLTGLRKFTQYNIQVLASTRVGDGVLSNVITVRTASDVPGPPIIIYFPQVNETSATVVWQSPEEPNGIIINYKVSYKRKDEPDSAFTNQTIDLPETVFQFTVSRLAAETYYVFAVQARTQDGWGQAATVDVYTISHRERPDPPVNLRIDTSEVLSRSVSIMWVPGNDNFGPIRNFTVQYRKHGESWQTVEGTIKPQQTSYTVKGLQPNTLYSFRVASVNDIGMSDFSAASQDVRTQPDKPDGAPQNVKIVAVTRTSIKITWDPPPESTWNGRLTSDIVQYREEGTETFRDSTVLYGQFTATLQELTMGVRYEIQVLTANEIGRGPPSVLQVFLVGDVAPFDPPSDIRVTNKSSTELEITWRPPPDDSTNGKLTGYNVYYWQSVTSKCEPSTTTLYYVTDLSIILRNLKPYTIYCSTVQALNIAGEGPRSTPIPKQTSEDLPSAPQNVRFKNVTLRELTILWDAPLTPNGNITNYQLQYFTSIDNEKTDVSTRVLPGGDRQQYINDLLENQSYTFTLAAINSIGKGTPAKAIIVTGPQPGSPQAPLQPVVTYKLKTVYLTWTNQGEGNSSIQGYHICYLEEGKPGSCVPILDVNHVEPSAQINLSALKPGISYSFIVRAINAQGISPPSPPSEQYLTPSSLIRAQSSPFHTQWWFLVIVALSGAIVILLIITLLCCLQKRRKKETEMKRSTTITTVMSATPEPEETRFPALELRQSSRSLARNGKLHNNTNNAYARSPPRPSPASVTYAEGLNLPIISGAAAVAARRPHMADDASSVLSDKPSNLGDSSDESSNDSDDSSTDSIVKAPVPASPPPPAFSSHYSRSGKSNNNNSARASSSSSNPNMRHHNPPSKSQNPHNAYTYTDSEADSSHYAFSLNNGNIVVNNVAGARTPLSGFSSFV
ncbi:hypothetical protein BsWGS_05876 [Bradybaena similaris]